MISPPPLDAALFMERNRTGSMKLDYGRIGFAANSAPDVINLSRPIGGTTISANDYARKRTYGENDRRTTTGPGTIDIELDCSPLTRHDRPSSVHYAEAIVMPGAVIANYTVVMPI